MAFSVTGWNFGKLSLEVSSTVGTSVNCLWKCPQQTKARAILARHLNGGVNRFHQWPLLPSLILMKNSSFFPFSALGLVKECMDARRFVRSRSSLDILQKFLLQDVGERLKGKG